jgi:tetratricopeptide (TPR) repeat protein
MARDESRTIRVRCLTWDQVEQFYAQKLRGDALVVKMPVMPALGEGVTVALGLPSGLVFALDGSVAQVGAQDTTGKWPVAMKMHGLTREVRDRLARLVADGRAGLLSSPAIAPPAPPGGTTTMPRPRTEPLAADGSELVPAPVAPRLDDVAPDERPVFTALEQLDRRLRERPAHEVLGVAVDADLRQVRAAYFALAKQHHPDAYARHRSPAVHQLAQELFIFVNRAYDRLRESALRDTGVSVPGPAMSGGPGWWLDPRDAEPAPADEAGEIAVELVIDNPGEPAAEVASESTSGPKNLADELFGDLGPQEEAPPFDTPVPASTERALSLANAGRASLAAGRFDEARGSFAAALKLDGKNREVRALYFVASGLLLRARGQHAEAQVQLETALGHDPGCGEAQRALGRTRRE